MGQISDLANAIKKGNKDDLTPLHTAVRSGHIKVVEFLVKNGAEINAITTDKQNPKTPLDLANDISEDTPKKKGIKQEIIKLLQKRKAKTYRQLELGLIAAAKNGNKDRVKKLLDQGVDPNAFYKNRTALHWAASKGDVKLVTILLNTEEVNVNIKTTDKKRLTPLHFAAMQGYQEIVDLLLKKRADIKAIAHYKHKDVTPLDLANEHHHTEIVESLSKSNTQENKNPNLQPHQNNNQEPTTYSEEEMKTKELALIIEKKEESLSQNELAADDPTVSPSNSSETSPEKVNRTEANSDDSLPNDSKEASSLLETETKAENETKSSVERTPAKNIQDNSTLQQNTQENTYSEGEMQTRELELIEVAKDGNEDLVKKLLDEGVNPNATEADSKATPLHHAAEKGCEEIVDLLLKAGANVNATDNNNHTPLHWASNTKIGTKLLEARNRKSLELIEAAKTRDKAAVEELLNQGVDPNVGDKNNNWTALHYAALRGYTEVVDLLLNRKANVHKKTANGSIPLHFAINEEITKLLLSHGNKETLEAKNEYGLTPLHLAVRNGHIKVVEFLVEEGAEINAITTDKQNPKTPLDLANDISEDTPKKKGIKQEIINLLKRNKAKTYEELELIEAAKAGNLSQNEPAANENPDDQNTIVIHSNDSATSPEKVDYTKALPQSLPTRNIQENKKNDNKEPRVSSEIEPKAKNKTKTIKDDTKVKEKTNITSDQEDAKKNSSNVTINANIINNKTIKPLTAGIRILALSTVAIGTICMANPKNFIGNNNSELRIGLSIATIVVGLAALTLVTCIGCRKLEGNQQTNDEIPSPIDSTVSNSTVTEVINERPTQQP